jgi:hypothetical protein
VEEPDIAPADRFRPGTRAGRWLASSLLPKPIDRALVLFAIRTMGRSRQHRLVLAAYAGIGLAIALVYLRAAETGVALRIGTLVLLCFAVAGVRGVFSLPLELRANWIFRITLVDSPKAYLNAVRKSLYALAAIPLLLISALLSGFAHTSVLLAVAIILVETSLYGFRKLPFACSYLPGKANLNLKLGIYLVLFLITADLGVSLEGWAMQHPLRFIVFLGLLAAVAIWRRRRTAEFVASPYNNVQFEDALPPEIATLDLTSLSPGRG